MNSSFKRGLFIVTLTGVISISGETAEASDDYVEMSLPEWELRRCWMTAAQRTAI